MSIRSFPLGLVEANQLRREIAESDSDATVKVVGRNRNFYVRIDHPDGRVEMRGREEGRLRQPVSTPRHIRVTVTERARLAESMKNRS